MLCQLLRNNGKSWRIYQNLAHTMRLKTLHFTQCGDTQFQANTLVALAIIFRSYLVTMMFIENVEEQGESVQMNIYKVMPIKKTYISMMSQGFKRSHKKGPTVLHIYFLSLSNNAM